MEILTQNEEALADSKETSQSISKKEINQIKAHKLSPLYSTYQFFYCNIDFPSVQGLSNLEIQYYFFACRKNEQHTLNPLSLQFPTLYLAYLI